MKRESGRETEKRIRNNIEIRKSSIVRENNQLFQYYDSELPVIAERKIAENFKIYTQEIKELIEGKRQICDTKAYTVTDNLGCAITFMNIFLGRVSKEDSKVAIDYMFKCRKSRDFPLLVKQVCSLTPDQMKTFLSKVHTDICENKFDKDIANKEYIPSIRRMYVAKLDKKETGIER